MCYGKALIANLHLFIFTVVSFIRHADVLAADISEDLCIKYIDRFLVFYVSTADLLQRAAPWLEKLEGGEDYRAPSNPNPNAATMMGLTTFTHKCLITCLACP